MKIVDSIKAIPPTSHPIALAIGVFDGIHLGHQAIIKELHKLTRKGGTRALLTFSNHPSSILSKGRPTSLIMSLDHRMHLFKKYGIDLTIALPFTREFSELSYLDFLHLLYQKLPFSQLVLGEGAAFGKNREGNATRLKTLEDEISFKANYLKKEHFHKEIVSSKEIRKSICRGELKKIKKKLGRPYSIWKSFHPTLLNRENETLFSLSFKEQHLCMLPSAVYGVDLEWEEETTSGIAFLNGKTEPMGSTLSITIYMEKKPPPESHFLNIAFIKYLHKEIDPVLFNSISASPLENLSAELSLS